MRARSFRRAQLRRARKETTERHLQAWHNHLLLERVARSWIGRVLLWWHSRRARKELEARVSIQRELDQAGAK